MLEVYYNTNNTNDYLSINDPLREYRFTLDYSELANPNNSDNNYLDQLILQGDSFEKRIKYLLPNTEDTTCRIIVKNVPTSTSTEEKCEYEDLIILLTSQYSKSYQIIFKDGEERTGLRAGIDNNGGVLHLEISKTKFSGNAIVKMHLFLFSMLGITKSIIEDASSIECKDDKEQIPLHVYRIFTHATHQSWYIGTHSFNPGCGMEKYLESVEFFQNLTIEKLNSLFDQLNKKTTDNGQFYQIALDVNIFVRETLTCFEESKNYEIFEEKEMSIITFRQFIIATEQSRNEEIHQIFHRFIKAIDSHIVIVQFLIENMNEELLKEILDTDYRHFVHLEKSNHCQKEIKTMKFSNFESLAVKE
jgi:hypothetical protein